MSSADFLALSPLVLAAGGSIIVLLVSAFAGKRPAPSFAAALVVLALALAAIGLAWSEAPRAVGSLVKIDGFTLFAQALIFATAFLVALASYRYMAPRSGEESGGDSGGEYYFLLLLASLGASILAAATSFVTLFLGLELLSVSLFSLIAFRREKTIGAQAGFMYLILAGASSAFLLFGMALAFMATGSLKTADLAAALVSGTPDILVLASLGLMTVGIGFKLAAVPFHLWTPEVYDAAPTPVTAFIATVSKGAMAVFLVRFFAPSGLASAGAYPWIFAAVAALSMFAGNLLALRERRIKRILAYSSIAHIGYILIAIIAGPGRAAPTVAFYLVAYFAASLGAFAAISALSQGDAEHDGLDSYRGLASRRPGLAAGLALAMLSLAGLPLTAGFMGKFLIFAAGEGAFLWVLAVLLAVNSTISIYYYLRVVSIMYSPEAETAAGEAFGEAAGATSGTPRPRSARAFGPAAAVVIVAAVVVIALGIFPGPLIDLIRSLTSGY